MRNISELIAAQMEFYKKAYEILAELAPVVDGLQEEQEVSLGLQPDPDQTQRQWSA